MRCSALVSTASSGYQTKKPGNPFLHRYLDEIKQYRIIDKDSSTRLAIKFQTTGDQEAAHQLVLTNLRLVVKIALDYQKYWHTSFPDLIQEGNAGLVVAVKKYDPDRGVKFSTYAAYWIKAFILKYMMDNWRVVKICTTPTMRRMFFSYFKEKRQLEQQGIMEVDSRLSDRLQIKQEEIAGIHERLYNTDLSTNAPLSADSSWCLEDTLEPLSPGVEEKVEREDLYSKLHQVLSMEKEKLTHRENIILFERLLADDPPTLHEMGKQLKISHERVRQLEIGLVKKLKRILINTLGRDMNQIFDN